MRLRHLVARGFRNLEAVDRDLPQEGVVLLGANGQGKTNLLEAVYYPVLFRSLRGAADQEVACFGGAGFHVGAAIESGGVPRRLAATWAPGAKRKRIALDGDESTRLTDAIGAWVAVAFLPGDVRLAGGSAGERRHYLDRMLSLADRHYLRVLVDYRAALAQRNAALRAGRGDLAAAFDRPLAENGAQVVAARQSWAAGAAPRFGHELAALGERDTGALRYHGRAELAEAGAWPEMLEGARARDTARRLTTVGPHRDDVVLEIGGRELRTFGSTGQQRSAAIALKLIELETLAAARGEEPALLLDDVFAELDAERQGRLAERLIRPACRQVFLTAPRPDELPGAVELPVWRMRDGRIAPD